MPVAERLVLSEAEASRSSASRVLFSGLGPETRSRRHCNEVTMNQEKPLVNNTYLLQKFPGKGGWVYAADSCVIFGEAKFWKSITTFAKYSKNSNP